jgi:hypothetical protein
LLSVIDLDALTSKKVSGRKRGASSYTAVEHVALLSIMSENPDASMLVYSAFKCIA